MSARRLAALAALLAVAFPGGAAAQYREFVGPLHEHSAYSDGWPGTRPADVFASIRSYGNHFGGISDHSDNMGIPAVFSEACYGEGRGEDPKEVHAGECALADQVNPLDSFRKWEATAEQAAAATTEGFTAFRGFEWSSDRFGHLNVFFSTNWTSAYTDGGFAEMATFWSWFQRPATLGGGSDGIATFNHPSGKDLEPLPGLNWNDFAYQPAADERVIGIEVYNDTRDYGSNGPPEGHYVHALDKGWHLGAVGAEDLGHRKPPADNWGGPEWAKTVILAPTQSAQDLRAALLDRRFYAIAPGENALRLWFTVDGAPMGSRLQRAARQKLAIAAATSDPGLTLELVTSGGEVLARGAGELSDKRKASTGEPWYFVRARRGDSVVAYSSPVWIEAVDDGRSGSWLAGDMHVHTCYSHDAWCPTGDDNTGPDTFYSSGGSVGERFSEGYAKGLDFVNISDHNDTRAWRDADFGSHGVVGLHSYEASLAGGHAHVIGVRREYDRGPGGSHEADAASTAAMSDTVHADGGLFQANHPSYRFDKVPTGCTDMELADWDENFMHWKYGFHVQPDSIEVWNPTSLLAPAERYWECWLDRGARMPVTAGSDTHGAQGQVGTPTTWVFSRSRRERDIVASMEAGRTTLSRLAPAGGGLRLLLEADPKSDGSWSAMVGDTVKPGTPMRVRAEGLGGAGLVNVRATGGQSLVKDERLAPGGVIEFAAPAPGWVRASLSLPEPLLAADPGCSPNESPVSLCSHDLAVAAMTSPLYVGTPPRERETRARGPVGDPGPGEQPSDVDEPDSEAPMAPAAHSKYSGRGRTLGAKRAQGRYPRTLRRR